MHGPFILSIDEKGRAGSAKIKGRLVMIFLFLERWSFFRGCMASIKEQHHIATFGESTPQNPTGFANVLRITITGNASSRMSAISPVPTMNMRQTCF